MVQVLPGGQGTPPPPGEHWRQTFITHAGRPGFVAQSALAPHSRQVFAPVRTQMGVGCAHCVLSRQASQTFATQTGRPAVVQSVSTAHWRHVVPTQTGPVAFPAQCVLFWHCTHMLLVRLQARLLFGAVAQSASDMQRSWQLLLLPVMMQTCGGVQPWVVVHTRQVFVGRLQ
jgi:hypothetical protein